MNLPRSLTDITHDVGGVLRCETCHSKRRTRPSYWREGWPTCCGQTMRWWTARQIDAGEMPVR